MSEPLISITHSTVTIVLQQLTDEEKKKIGSDFLEEIERQAALRYGVDYEQPANRG